MDEWIIGSRIPYIDNGVFQVQTKHDTVRIVKRNPQLDTDTLWFQDCTHPAQNAICNAEYIKAWRLNPAKNPAK